MSDTPNQIPLFDQPRTILDQLRVLWGRATEAERMIFLDELRRAFLFRRKPSAAAPDRQRKPDVK